jgi:membrane-bound lytic murein transglycosylase D
LLRSLARKEQAGALETLTPEEQRVYNLFADIPGEHKFTKAAARPMRAQPGLHERFREAIRTSGLYQRKFIEIFEAHDLPLELTRLPFVESFFKYSAYSSAGAAGVWQFIPSTARLYGLRMTRAVDERYDPFKSAESAARLLKANYAIFETWPLAITAYNHGPVGLRRAVKQLGTTDFGTIATTYRGKRFGFYSRNYYAQFLAVVQIMQQPQRYFDEIEYFPPLQYEEIRLTHRMYVNDLVQLLAISKEDLLVLNRDLKRATLQSKTPIPKNYVLKLPPGKKQQLLSELAQRSAVTS